jgi:GAF domain-containing protein
MAQSTMLGFVHLQKPTEHAASEPFTESELRLVQITAEEMALSLANADCREVLRQQAFRDFADRLVQSPVSRGSSRHRIAASQAQELAVALIMIDVDDFKHSMTPMAMRRATPCFEL